MLKEWNGFKEGKWTKETNVRDFIQKNYTLYEGDDSFLAGVSEKTEKVWNKCEELLSEETKKGGVLDVERPILFPASLTLHPDISTKKMKSL